MRRPSRSIATRLAFANEHVAVHDDTIATADGSQRSHVRLEYHGNPPGVVIVPRDGHGDLLLLRVYRHVFGTEELELPRGTAHPGEAPDVAAARELREETAIEPVRVRLLGYLRPDSALLMTEAAVFLADLPADFRRRLRPDTEEGIDAAVVLSRSEVAELAQRGALRDGITLGALALLLIDEAGRSPG